MKTLCENKYLQQYRHKTIKEFLNNDLHQLYTSTLTQCGLSKASLRQKLFLHLCSYSLGHQFCMLDLLQLQEPGLNYICYRNPADIRFSWPVKTFRWSRWVQIGNLQVLLHSVNLLNITNPPFLIVSGCDILIQTHGLCGHPTKICLSGDVN